MIDDEVFRQMPFDLRLDMTIDKLGFGSPCLAKQIGSKTRAWLEEREANEPHPARSQPRRRKRA
jgi:hypothetical protein